MFGNHFEIQDGCLSLIKLTNIILTVAAETLNPCSDMKLIPLIYHTVEEPSYSTSQLCDKASIHYHEVY